MYSTFDVFVVDRMGLYFVTCLDTKHIMTHGALIFV